MSGCVIATIDTSDRDGMHNMWKKLMEGCLSDPFNIEYSWLSFGENYMSVDIKADQFPKLIKFVEEFNFSLFTKKINDGDWNCRMITDRRFSINPSMKALAKRIEEERK